MRKIATILILLGVIAFASADLIPVPFQSCSSAGSAFSPEKAFISLTPKAGVTEQITIEGKANSEFTFADAQVTATVLGITVLNQKVSLSGSYKAGDAVTAVASLEIPSWAPAATATVYVRAHDASGTELACGQTQITITSSISLTEEILLLPNDLIPVPFQSCSAAGSAFTPKEAFISQTPKAGVTEQITINGLANAAFTFADAQVTATVLGITVLSQKVVLSGSYKAGDAVSAVASLEIPRWAPAATATVYVRAHDAAGNELACGQAQITISSSLSVESFKSSFTSIAQLLKRKHKKHLGDNIPLPFTNCGSATDALNVQNVYITAPIAKGITEGVIIQGAARSAFTLSSAVAKVKFIGITVATKSFSFSNSYNAGDSVSITLSIDIPSIAPSGTYSIEVTATDNNGSQVACGSVSIKISSTAYETPVPWPFSNCGGSSDPVSVSNITLSDTPAKGVAENIVVNGVANQAVSLAKATVSVSYLGITLYTGEVALSGSYNVGDPITINYDVTVPSEAPSGTYTITIKVFNPSGSQLSCDKTSVKL